MKTNKRNLFLLCISTIFFIGIFFPFQLKSTYAASLADEACEKADNNSTESACNSCNSEGLYWFDNGEIVTDREVYDPETDAWYWFDSDGTMARNKEVFLTTNDERTEGKWVYYDENGHMIKGFFSLTDDNGNEKTVFYDYITGAMQHDEYCIDNNWYRFDSITGAMICGEYANENGWYYYDEDTGIMQKGFVNLTCDSYEKTVFYDYITGIMQHGEYCIDDDWYRFDDITGQMICGEYVNENGWYYYNETSGIMQKGVVKHHNNEYYYDTITGIMHHGLVERNGMMYKYDDITGVFICITNECVPSDGKNWEIICWGDSMTQGVGTGAGYIFNEDGTKINISNSTYPGVLASKTGIKTYNMGIGGETSREIMKRAVEYHKNSSQQSILILEIGSNGGWDNNYDLLIKQYKKIIASAITDYYIIVGDTDDPGTSLGDLNQTEFDKNGNYVGLNETMWEAALREAFGEHFINMRQYLIKNGLSDVNLTADENDLCDQTCGRISKKLRFDWTHFNAYGYYSKANGIYQKGVELGYWK